MTNKKIKIFTSFALLSFMISSISFAEVKIGYIDMQKAIQSTKSGKKAKKTLEKSFEKKKKELKKKEADLIKMRDDLKKRSLVLSDDIRMKKQGELQKEMLKYRELVANSQREIQTKERELTMPILKKIRKAVADIAKKEKYTMILEKSEQSVLWAMKEVDLTDKVVKAVGK